MTSGPRTIWAAREAQIRFLAPTCVLAGAAGFLALAWAVRAAPSGEALGGLDRAVLLAFRGADGALLGPAWLPETARDVTALGSYFALLLFAFAVVVWLLLHGQRRQALFAAVAVGGGMAISNLLKAMFDRARPDLAPHAVETFSASFPSGHAMLSAVVYLTLATVLAEFALRRRDRVFAFGLAAALAVLIGASRVYLGVHWPSDVLAGWCVGVAWPALCWLAGRRLGR